MSKPNQLRQAKEIALVHSLRIERERLVTQTSSQALAQAKSAQAQLAERHHNEIASINRALRNGTTLSIDMLEAARASISDFEVDSARAQRRTSDAATQLARQQESFATALQQQNVAAGLVSKATAAVTRTDEERRAQAAEQQFLSKWIAT